MMKLHDDDPYYRDELHGCSAEQPEQALELFVGNNDDVEFDESGSHYAVI